MKNLISLSICLILAIYVNTALALPGLGTQEDPWRIKSLAHFNEFAADANYWDDWTRLETDVNLAGQTYSTAVIAPDTGRHWDFQGTAFTGVFNGNGHKIIALTIDDGGAGNDYLGLFGKNGGQVRNLSLKGGSVSGPGYYVGGLVGKNGGTVSNCHSIGDVSGDWRVGGLVGRNNGSISNSHSTGSVSGDDNVGGLVGYNYYGSVSNCYSTGSVSGDDWVGGLVGRNHKGNLSNCNSTGSVSGGRRVGGLVGTNGSTMGTNGSSVSNCYSTGDVSGNGAVGGLVGVNVGSVSNCYSTGDVSGNRIVGGLVGHNRGSISSCFSDTETQTHGVSESFGENWGTVTNVKGLPTVEMQDANTFTDAGWDFTTPIWQMCELPDYPRLWWEKCPIEATIDIKPETLNLNSKGRWITSYIWFPEDYNVGDIEPNSVVIEGEPNDIYAEWIWYNEKQNIVMAKFNRSEVQQILDDEGIIEIGEAELTVSGELTDGTVFEGTDTIRVINKGGKN